MGTRALKAACLALCLAVMWMAVPADAGTVVPNTHASITATEGMTDLYFLYRFQYSGGSSLTSVTWLSSLINAGPSSFDFYATKEAAGSSGSGVYAIIGLSQSGLGSVDVSLANGYADDAIDDWMTWNDVFDYHGFPNPFEEWKVANALGDGNTTLLTQFTNQYYSMFAPMGSSGRLVDFCFASDGGPVSANNIVPEPSSMLALGMGLIGLAGFARRRRK